MTPGDAAAAVRAFWAAMGTNDFAAAARHLAPEAVVVMHLSGEMIVGPDAVAAFNAAFPATGRWRFDIRKLVAAADEVVTDVAVSDARRTDRVISFFTLRDDRIARIVEYWPEPTPVPADRPRAAPIPDGWNVHGPLPDPRSTP